MVDAEDVVIPDLAMEDEPLPVLSIIGNVARRRHDRVHVARCYCGRLRQHLNLQREWIAGVHYSSPSYLSRETVLVPKRWHFIRLEEFRHVVPEHIQRRGASDVLNSDRDYEGNPGRHRNGLFTGNSEPRP